MTNIPNADWLQAMRLTKSGRLNEATAALQRRLGGSPVMPGATSPSRRTPRTTAATVEAGGTDRAKPTFRIDPLAASSGAERRSFIPAAGAKTAIPEALRGFLDQVSQGEPRLPDGLSRAAQPAPMPDGARFLDASFSDTTGSRPYKLYIPSAYRTGLAIPLIVMLHGCTQSPDDFAAGTRMNQIGEAHTCLVVYPGQTASANTQRCWNWFRETDQYRDQGEPALIAGITRKVMHEYNVDPQRVFAAGLSAGGAAAAILGTAYPDIYAAIGVHSGLACGAASDISSAFAAMQGKAPLRAHDTWSRSSPHGLVPAIVFHGDRDTTVNLRNGEAVVAQSTQSTTLEKHTEKGQVPGGRAYTRTLHVNADGQAVVEQWVVHGAGHAWFGGNPTGSYTDPHGPDASREMLRFFLQHPKPASTLQV